MLKTFPNCPEGIVFYSGAYKNCLISASDFCPFIMYLLSENRGQTTVFQENRKTVVCPLFFSIFLTKGHHCGAV